MPEYKTDISAIPVTMQGFQPCCVEAALCTAIEYYYWKRTGIYTPLSFRFLASLTASKDNINYVQGGTSLAVAFEIAKTIGVCTAGTYPNDIGISPTEFVELSLIPQAAYDEAAQYKIPGYATMENITWEAVNQAIAAQGIVLTGLFLDKEWYLSSEPNSNPMPLPPPLGPNDPSKSGHMTLSYGYDQKYRYLRNSFGTTFGLNGDGCYAPDYQPYIYSAGYIVGDAVTLAAQDAAEVSQDFTKVAGPTAPQQLSLIGQAIALIKQMLQ